MALKHLKFITAILTAGAFAAALSTAAPAHAGNRDGVKIILGTAATILLLNEVTKHQKKKDRKEQRAHAPIPPAPAPQMNSHARQDQRGGGGRFQGHHDRHDRFERSRPTALPRQCLRDTRHQGLVMGAGCLNRNYDGARALPGACRTEFRNNGKFRQGYDYSCLRSRGFALARR